LYRNENDGDVLPDDSTNFSTHELNTSAEIAVRKATLPILNWELPEHRKLIPGDLQQIIGADSDVISVDPHALEVIQPPPAGVKVNRAGDAVDGAIGKHYSVREHFTNLDHLFGEWKLQGISTKSPEGETRWEIYIPIDSRKWLLTVIGVRHDEKRHYLVSIYPINDGSVQNRIALNYLQQR
jgi:hypothetical protein